VFSALFFVSVGMLFDPVFMLSSPLPVLAALAVVLLVKPLVALAIVLVMRGSLRTALTVAVGLAQIGEFSFILAALGMSLAILPPQGMDALVAAAIVSIAVNPLLFRALDAIEARLGPATAVTRMEPPKPEAVPEIAPVIVTGLGELAQRLARRCAASGVPVCVIGDDLDVLETLRGSGVTTVFGDPGRQDLLRAAGLARARVLVITTPALAEKMRICIAAREAGPRVMVVATAGGEGERVWLQEFGVAYVCDALDGMTDELLRAIRNGL
jgi:CPA2 family monovalent cation:H+ antiporter-2